MDQSPSIAQLSNIIGRKPSAEAYYRRGVTYLRSPDRLLRAIRDFNEAIKRNPRYARAYSARGWAHLQMGESDKAFVDLTRAINIAPKDAYLYYNRGRAYLKMKQFDDAICNFTHTINLNPEFAPAYTHRATSYQAMGEIDKARLDFDKADRIEER